MTSLVVALTLVSVEGGETRPQSTQPEVIVEKQIIYQKETVVDLTGTAVEAERQSPPAFFLSKSQTPDARGLLNDRLRFSFRDYNLLGF